MARSRTFPDPTTPRPAPAPLPSPALLREVRAQVAALRYPHAASDDPLLGHVKGFGEVTFDDTKAAVLKLLDDAIR